MGLDDLIIKKYLKKYVRRVLMKKLKRPKKPLKTKKQVVNYLTRSIEILYGDLLLKGLE